MINPTVWMAYPKCWMDMEVLSVGVVAINAYWSEISMCDNTKLHLSLPLFPLRQKRPKVLWCGEKRREGWGMSWVDWTIQVGNDGFWKG